ncbi:phosphate signaling complex protein PhoU [Caldichromatium japonicum]|uniref:Phosphate-specific transport system accessory protein PhoU n=1 Tax=Caldichromatium japonicum TaxID=2699430 RepID=A0A6G7VCK3_9GAMM|nr:phosphate signaling complex protein PhoU [Caldichromatium japonicum]QIK37606.1 phosphate signaling complex protein PhoU [Caldichromatium japonicum]
MNEQEGKQPATDLLAGHTVRRYDQELARLHTIILQMGEHVSEQVQAAVKALLDDDDYQAYRVLDREPQIDYLSLDADEEVFRLIVRRQPAAVDLRIVMALSKITAEFERAGDKAARIAHQVIEWIQETDVLVEPVRAAFQSLNEQAIGMFERSLRAVATFDVSQSLAIFEKEPELDRAARALRELLSDPAQGGLASRYAITLFYCAQALKHIGRHASNIAELVIYVALGQDVRYRNREILIETLRHRGY